MYLPAEEAMVWSWDGPVSSDDVGPWFNCQSKLSDLFWVQEQNPLSKSQPYICIQASFVSWKQMYTYTCVNVKRNEYKYYVLKLKLSVI